METNSEGACKVRCSVSLFFKRCYISSDNVFFRNGKDSGMKAAWGGVIIGENCQIGRSEKGYHAGMPFYTTLYNDGDNSYITIGNNCRINGAFIHAKDIITIGDNCVIASGISIIDSNGHQVCSSNRTMGRDIAKSISIGNNVWIGINSIILKGTTIGDNCIVSAGSVCKGVYPKNSIVSGNPANVVKKIDIPLDNN